MFHWIFKHKTENLYPLLSGMTDIHSHLLFGIDDGVENLREATDIVLKLKNAGIRRIICTPHIMADMPQNQKVYLIKRFKKFKKQLPGDIEFGLAAEYMLDSKFLSHLAGGLLTYDGVRVLLETSCLLAPSRLDSLLYDVALSGYQPVIAHPERYLYMDYQYCTLLKERGCLFQLNLLSLCGYYGKTVQTRVGWLLKKEYYNFVGTDLHNAAQCDVLLHCKISAGNKQRVMQLIKQNNNLWEHVIQENR